MSELKAYIAPTPDGTGLAEYYLKSEADKVIAHNKYKRCLAMAEWCNANCMHTVLLIGHKIMPHWEWRIKTNYWYKWRKIWFELCKKFKEGN